MLVVEGLTCRFGTKAAVDNASFSIAPGGFVGVIGRSGAGKTVRPGRNGNRPRVQGRVLRRRDPVARQQAGQEPADERAVVAGQRHQSARGLSRGADRRFAGDDQ